MCETDRQEILLRKQRLHEMIEKADPDKIRGLCCFLSVVQEQIELQLAVESLLREAQ